MSLLSQLGHHRGRLFALAKPSAFVGSRVIAPKSTGTAQEQMDEFWMKNKKLNRPMSPHITVYRMWEVTSALSLTHRATGIALAGATVGFAFAVPFLPENFDQTIMTLQSYGNSWLGYLILMDMKFLLVWPIIFHTLNGIRHLIWDTGKGFDMGELRKSGYAVVALSLLISAAIVYCCK